MGNKTSSVPSVGSVGVVNNSARTFVIALQERGVELWSPEPDKLRFSPKNALSAEEVASLKEHKADILNILVEKSYRGTRGTQPDTYAENSVNLSPEKVHKRYTPTSTPPVETPKRVPEVVHRERERRRLEAERLGLISRWSHEFGYISIHDPTTGEWHDLLTKDAPPWAKTEAFKRKELRETRGVERLLTRGEMEELWVEDRGLVEDEWAVDERGIVYEDYLPGEEE